MKIYFSRSLYILLTLLLAACGPLAPTPTITPSAANILMATPSSTSEPEATPTLYPTIMVPTPDFRTPHYTHTPFPTPLINEQMFSSWLTQNAEATPIRTPVVLEKKEKYPRVYAKDGNLYFQRNASQPVQLTSSGKDREPLLSDDGQKIVFYRGESTDRIHFINSDGSREHTVITSETSLLVGKGDIVSPIFVPRTHILLFNTYLCGPRLGLYNGPECQAGVYSLDTDTWNIEKIIGDLSGSAWKDRNFEISPNGKYISVAGSGHVNLYVLSSGRFELAYPNIIEYYITTPDEYLPVQYWFPNSNGLIIIVANSQFNDPADPPSNYLAFRYTLEEKQGQQIPLEKSIIRGDGWCVSPDRNWILFTGIGKDALDYDFNYLANLITGHTQTFEKAGLSLYDCQWSPDSKHFVSNTNTINFIGSVDGSLPIPVGGHFIKWIDNTHYYYLVIDGNRTDTKTYIGKISEH